MAAIADFRVLDPLPRLRALQQRFPVPPGFDEADPACQPAYRSLRDADLGMELEAYSAAFAELFAKQPLPASARSIAFHLGGAGPSFNLSASAYPMVPLAFLNLPDNPFDEEKPGWPDDIWFADAPPVASPFIQGIYTYFLRCDITAPGFRQEILVYLSSALLEYRGHVLPWLVARHRELILGDCASLHVLLMAQEVPGYHLLGRMSPRGWEPPEAAIAAVGADPAENIPFPEARELARELYPQWFTEEYPAPSLSGTDPMPALLEIQRNLPVPPGFDESDASSWPTYRFLRDRDMAEDLRAYADAFAGIFANGGPPPNVRAVSLWVIGSGPNFPLGVTGFSKMPLPITDEVIDDYPDDGDFAMGEEVWEVADVRIVSEYLQGIDAYLTEFDQRHGKSKARAKFRKALQRYEFGSVHDYGEAVFPWLILRHRNDLLANLDEVYIVYGFHGFGEPLVMGRLTRDKWETVHDLLRDRG